MSRYDCRRCAWRAGPDQGATPKAQLRQHANETGHDVCTVCMTSLARESRQTCLACIATTRRQLDSIVELYATLPEALARYPTPQDWRRNGPRGRETALPGGDALVMLAGGSKGRSQDRGVRIGGVLDYAHEADELRSDPPSLAAELGAWEDDWRHQRGEPAAPFPPHVATSAEYLSIRLGWAGDQHPAFDEFARDIERLHKRIHDALHLTEHPETGAPCFDCNATLERHYGPHGRVDEWRCPRCRRVYDSASYWLAVRAQLEREANA